MLRAGRRFGVGVGVVDVHLTGMDGNDTVRGIWGLQADTQILIHTGPLNYKLPDHLVAARLNGQRVFYKPLHDLDPLSRAIVALSAAPPWGS